MCVRFLKSFFFFVFFFLLLLFLSDMVVCFEKNAHFENEEKIEFTKKKHVIVAPVLALDICCCWRCLMLLFLVQYEECDLICVANVSSCVFSDKFHLLHQHSTRPVYQTPQAEYVISET